MADGGFVPATPTGLPSPSPTPSAASTLTGLDGPSASALPVPRSKPLRAGSAKDVRLRAHLDEAINQIHNRWVRKFGIDADHDVGAVSSQDVVMENDGISIPLDERKPGYVSMREICADVSALVSLVWLSGTPTLQTSYLLVLADLVPSYFPSFHASPRPLFALLTKLDAAFSQLLQSRSLAGRVNRQGLGGIYVSREEGLTQTDIVRLKSIVNRTKIEVTKMVGGETEVLGDEDEEEDEIGLAEEDEDEVMAREDGQWDMQSARVYEKTILGVGDQFGGVV